MTLTWTFRTTFSYVSHSIVTPGRRTTPRFALKFSINTFTLKARVSQSIWFPRFSVSVRIPIIRTFWSEMHIDNEWLLCILLDSIIYYI